MGPPKGIPEPRPEARVLPARVRHDPIQVIERPPDKQVRVALACGQAVIKGQAIAPDQVGDDEVAVPDWLSVIHKIGQLSTRSIRCVEDVLVPKGEATQLQKSKDLEAV